VNFSARLPPDMHVPRLRWSPPTPGSAPVGRCLGGLESRKWLAGLVLAALATAGCRSSTPTAAQPKSGLGQSLSLAMSFGGALKAGDASTTAEFALTNKGSASFDGCFGPSWGVSVILEGVHDAGHIVRAARPSCDERFALLPGQTIVWSKKVPLSDLRPGSAKVTGWVRLVDPACDPYRDCHETSVASAPMTVAIGER
jgi:hypothetical protein